MEEQQQNNSLDSSKTVSRHNAYRYFTPVSIIICLIALVGLFLGIYNSIQTNHILSLLTEDGIVADTEELTIDDDEEESETELAKPASAESINQVTINYNDSNNIIAINNDNTIEFYTYNEDEDDYTANSVETDTTELIKYIFDNDVQYTNTEPSDEDEEYNWYLEINSNEGYAYASGTGETPDWLKGLIDKANGYRSTSE